MLAKPERDGQHEGEAVSSCRGIKKPVKLVPSRGRAFVVKSLGASAKNTPTGVYFIFSSFRALSPRTFFRSAAGSFMALTPARFSR